MAPFYGWSSTASRLQPLPGGSLLFTIQFPEIPGTLTEGGRTKFEGGGDVGPLCILWCNLLNVNKSTAFLNF